MRARYHSITRRSGSKSRTRAPDRGGRRSAGGKIVQANAAFDPQSRKSIGEIAFWRAIDMQAGPVSPI
jgi:hypothetical protein